MDYVKQLQEEIHGAHAVFHEFAMLISKKNNKDKFFFFEGDEDPSFYMAFAHPRMKSHDARIFICNGRAEVLKLLSLVEKDGRGVEHTMFFVDKDHTDFCSTNNPTNDALFQTNHYSIENYVVCQSVFGRYWVEKLHLPDVDPRKDEYIEIFDRLHRQFIAKSRLLTAAILIGRGIDGHQRIKLNLNNLQLDKVLKLDFEEVKCSYAKDAAVHFMTSTNLHNLALKNSEVRRICRKYLTQSSPKAFIRGKFELWFFWKFLSEITKQLSAKDEAKEKGYKRATPHMQMTQAGCFEFLAPLVPCPVELEKFFNRRLPI